LLCCGLGAARPFATPQANPDRITDRATSAAPGQVLLEEFSFYIKNFKMDHQGEVQTLNIKISAQYVNGIRATAYPDFRLIARDVETCLSKYPNKTDYWEIVNKRLTQLILDKYPVISQVMSEMEVSMSPLNPYVRASTVTRLRRKKRDVARE
jgi:hypothetical protein